MKPVFLFRSVAYSSVVVVCSMALLACSTVDSVGDGTAEQGSVAASSLAEAHSMGASLCVIATDTGQHSNDGLAAVDVGHSLDLDQNIAEAGFNGGSNRRVLGKELPIDSVIASEVAS